jgi:hypothetical protein
LNFMMSWLRSGRKSYSSLAPGCFSRCSMTGGMKGRICASRHTTMRCRYWRTPTCRGKTITLPYFAPMIFTTAESVKFAETH